MSIVYLDDPNEFDPDWIRDAESVTLAEFHLKGTANDHDQSTHAGGGSRRPARPRDVPPPIGKSPLPTGHRRAYHWTDEANRTSVVRNGLTVGTARGESYGEPNLVHLDASPNSWGPATRVGDDEWDFVGGNGRILVEVAIPEDTYLPTGGFDTQFTVPGDVPPSKILAIHESWHGRYRYFVDNPSLIERVEDGEYDDLIDFDDDYAKAIEAIKSVGPRNKGKSRQQWIQRFHLQGQHDQSKHGRRYKRATGVSEPDAGFTLSAEQLAPIREGYAVAIEGTDRLLLASNVFDDEGEPSPEYVKILRDRIEVVEQYDVPDGTRRAVGGWHNPGDGKVEVNVTVVFPQAERDRAFQFARDNDQIAMADLAAIAAEDWENAIIDTGGSGGNRDEERP